MFEIEMLILSCWKSCLYGSKEYYREVIFGKVPWLSSYTWANHNKETRDKQLRETFPDIILCETEEQEDKLRLLV